MSFGSQSLAVPDLADVRAAADELGPGSVDVVAGGYEDWERQRRLKVSGGKRENPRKVQPTAPPVAAPKVKLTYKDQRVDGSAWLAKMGDPYQASLFDGDGRVGIDFGVYGVPETFIIDKTGTIRLKHIGPLTADVIRTQIEPLLKKLDA